MRGIKNNFGDHLFSLKVFSIHKLTHKIESNSINLFLLNLQNVHFASFPRKI